MGVEKVGICTAADLVSWPKGKKKHLFPPLLLKFCFLTWKRHRRDALLYCFNSVGWARPDPWRGTSLHIPTCSRKLEHGRAAGTQTRTPDWSAGAVCFNSVTVAADFLFSSIYEKLKPDSNESSHTVLRPAVQCCKTWWLGNITSQFSTFLVSLNFKQFFSYVKVLEVMLNEHVRRNI